jgi:enoyl-[acyl-carrier protein] reductase II
LSLGAAGVWVGTRFIATPEAYGPRGYKEKLVAAREDDTVISRGYTGKTCRVLRNSYTQYWEEHPDELQPFPMQFMRSMEDGEPHGAGPEDGGSTRQPVLPSGQGVGAIADLVPAGELVRRFVSEAEAALDRAAAAR